MLYVLTESERRFLLETLRECAEASVDVEEVCSECAELLESLNKMTQDEYEEEQYVRQIKMAERT